MTVLSATFRNQDNVKQQMVPLETNLESLLVAAYMILLELITFGPNNSGIALLPEET